MVPLHAPASLLILHWIKGFWHFRPRSALQWNDEIQMSEIKKAPKSEQMGIRILAHADFKCSGFKNFGLKTERSVSTIKA